uniref:SPK domain-containing protein n=1 Tax=Caenorhabditis tropicalis TaxID=1561998 RepID=A0A1I7TXY7_9PELO
MGPYEKRAPWTSSEITKLLNFVAKQTEKASSFLSFQQLCNGYLESNQSNQSLSALRSQIIKFLTVKIDDLVEFEINSKVMMLYKLQIAPIESFVIRLFQTAEVLLDDVNRISYYKENKVGGLVLGSLPPEARNSERVERRERSRTPSLPTSLPVPNSEVDPDEPIILTEYLERPNNNDNSDSRSVSCVHSSQESKGEIEYNLN